MDDNDSDSSVFLLYITLIVCYSKESECILDMGVTYHACSEREWFASFKKLDGGLMSFDDSHTCHMEEIGTIRIKMSDVMLKKLKDVRYVPQLKKNVISIGALDKGLREALGEGILKMFNNSLVVLKGIRHNNLYYLKGNAVIDNLTTSERLDDDSTRLCHSKLGHVGLNSLQALARQRLLKGAKTCNLKSCEHCVLGKKTKVKFDTVIHHMEVLLDLSHMNDWGQAKTSLGGHWYFVSLFDDLSKHCWVYPMRQKFEVLNLFVKWKKLTEKQTGRKIKVLQFDNIGEYNRDNSCYLARIMILAYTSQWGS